MIDGHFKGSINHFWNYLAKGLVRLGLTPNQITWGGLGLIVFQCAIYPLHENNFVFGLGLLFTFALDALDGAVARITNTSTKYGGYLDAVVDRYQEWAVYFVLAWVWDWWAVCFLAITGSLLISYNKARTAVEIPINNDKWPDLLERMERVVILCVALMLDPYVSLPDFLGGSLLFAVILMLGILTHLTAIQRFHRAGKMIQSHSENKES